MDSNDNEELAQLEAAISYRFNNRRLLEEALTHRSFLNETGEKSARDNERLEFFGDAVIDFFLSSILLERFPDSREGDLTRIRASLVDEESLAFLAAKIGLGRYLRLGRGEERSGGREKRSILADAYEALLAAVYLDGGVLPVQALVGNHFAPLLENRAAATAGRDFKTEFQEQAQALRGTTPRYILKEASGPDHDRIFTVEAFVGDEFMGVGSGRSKKEAEQAAARGGVARLKLFATDEIS
ncbi:MAG: ribonuclease [Geobacteraceae bacterium]|nr:MAG: ribonuclease [Geobacteraceae bacterium]